MGDTTFGHDAFGSVVAHYDSSGALTQTFRYDVWGAYRSNPPTGPPLPPGPACQTDDVAARLDDVSKETSRDADELVNEGS